MIFGFRQSLKKENVRFKWDGFKLRWPILGRVSRNLNAARFARTMAGLIDSGTPALTSMETARHTLKNVVMRNAVSDACIKVREGSAAVQLLERPKFFRL